MVSSDTYIIGNLRNLMRSSSKVSMIVCPNGMGHFKRAALLSSRLISAGFSVCILTNGGKWKEFISTGKSFFEDIDKVFVENHDWLPMANEFRQGLDFRLRFETLVKTHADSIIISDNYLEPLITNSNVIVLANFFWHEIFEMPSNYRRALKTTLKRKESTIVSTMFGGSYINHLPNIQYVPLFGLPQPQVRSRGYIIFALGFGVWTNRYVEQIQKFLEDYREEMPRTIVLDRSLDGHLKSPRPDIEFIVRPFTQELIAGAEAVIGRPSLGIVTDAFALHVPFFPLSDGDAESVHNRRVIDNFYEGLNVSFEFGNRDIMRESLKDRSPEFGGEDALVKLIMDRVQ